MSDLEPADSTRKERWRKYKEDKVRWSTWSTQEDYDEITRKAKECNLSFNEYVRRCALGRKTIPRADSAFIAALSKLGGMQNKIMMDIHEKAGGRIEEVAALLPQARDIYREILMAVRRIRGNKEREHERSR